MHPFPFIGAGEAQYFEWADLHVCFEREPKPAERKKIAKGVPPPLADSVDFHGPLLYVASAQGVGRVIKATYAKTKKPVAKLTTQGRFTQASASEDARFLADTERWLEEIHAIVPILVAYRRQDWEAGGTKLSDWHKESIPKAAELLKRVVKVAGKHLSHAGYLGRGIVAEAEAAKVKIPKDLAKKFDDD